MITLRLARIKVTVVSSLRQCSGHSPRIRHHGLILNAQSTGRTSCKRLWPEVTQEAALLRSRNFVQKFHTTRPRYVNPTLLMVLRPLSRFLAILIGRGFRKWWEALPNQKKEVFISHLRRNKVRYMVICTLLGIVSVILYQRNVTTTPYTGRKRFMLLSSDQLTTISKAMYKKEMSEYGHLMMPEDHPMVNQLRRVGNKLLQGNSALPELSSKSWTISVIDEPTINCFVLSTGDVIMFRGMMDILENDDQVAAVLAHEMSHAILEHVAEHQSHAYLLDLLTLLPVALIWAIIPGYVLPAISDFFVNFLVSIFLELPYSRTLESEADSLGIQLTAKACFDVREWSVVWGKLAVLNKIMENNNLTVGIPTWLSTHPDNTERQKEMEKQIPGALKIHEYCQCQTLSPVDPRWLIEKIQRELAQREADKKRKVSGPEKPHAEQEESAPSIKLSPVKPLPHPNLLLTC